MNIQDIISQIRNEEYVFTLHADYERKADNLTIAQIEQALVSGAILEEYPDTGRGESCLVVGFANEQPIHVVCGWFGRKIALITVYIPAPPKFLDPWTRGNSTDD